MAEASTAPRLEALGEGRYRLSGELRFTTVTALRLQSMTLFSGRQLELDLAGVGRADSAGVALLLEWMRLARARDVDIHYRNLPEQLLGIARVSGLESLLPLAAEGDNKTP